MDLRSARRRGISKGRRLLNVLEFLDESRIEIGAKSPGNCEEAFLKALTHARERSQFNMPIIKFPGHWPQAGKDVEPGTVAQMAHLPSGRAV